MPPGRPAWWQGSWKACAGLFRHVPKPSSSVGCASHADQCEPTFVPEGALGPADRLHEKDTQSRQGDINVRHHNCQSCHKAICLSS